MYEVPHFEAMEYEEEDIKTIWREWKDGKRNLPEDECAHCGEKAVLLFTRDELDYICSGGSDAISHSIVSEEYWVHTKNGVHMCSGDSTGAYPKRKYQGEREGSY